MAKTHTTRDRLLGVRVTERELALLRDHARADHARHQRDGPTVTRGSCRGVWRCQTSDSANDGGAAMSKRPTEMEIPKNATEPIVRLQLEQIVKAVRAARPTRVERVVVTIRQE